MPSMSLRSSAENRCGVRVRGGRRGRSGRLSAPSGTSPSRYWRMEHAACSSISSRTPATAEPRCGVKRVRSRFARSEWGIESGRSRSALSSSSKHIRGISSEPTAGDSGGDRVLVDDRAPSDVDETTPGSYSPQGIGVDQVPRIRRKRGGAHDVVTRLEQLVQTHVVQVQPGPSPRIGRFGIDAENPGAAKSAETFRHCDSHSTRTQDPHGAPVKPSPRRETGAPAPKTHRFRTKRSPGPTLRARAISSPTASSAVGIVSRSGNHRDPHAAPSAGLDIEVVVALERTGHDAEVGTALQHLVVPPGPGMNASRAWGAACVGNQLFVRPRLQRPVADDFTARTQPLDHLTVGPGSKRRPEVSSCPPLPRRIRLRGFRVPAPVRAESCGCQRITEQRGSAPRRAPAGRTSRAGRSAAAPRAPAHRGAPIPESRSGAATPLPRHCHPQRKRPATDSTKGTTGSPLTGIATVFAHHPANRCSSGPRPRGRITRRTTAIHGSTTKTCITRKNSSGRTDRIACASTRVDEPVRTHRSHRERQRTPVVEDARAAALVLEQQGRNQHDGDTGEKHQRIALPEHEVADHDNEQRGRPHDGVVDRDVPELHAHDGQHEVQNDGNPRGDDERPDLQRGPRVGSRHCDMDARQ